MNEPTTPTPSPHGEPSTEERIAMLERQRQEHLDGWKRAKADYLNLKKQTDKEKQEIARFAVAQTVMRFLPIYDNLARALKHIPVKDQDQEWAKGLNHIRKLYEDALKAMGLMLIPTIGHPFDHARHHAVSKVKRPGITPGTIVEELKSGFMAENQVLEPANVIVAE